MHFRRHFCTAFLLGLCACSYLLGGCSPSDPKTTNQEYHLYYILGMAIEMVVQNASSASHTVNYKIGAAACDEIHGFPPNELPAGDSEHFSLRQGRVIRVAVDPESPSEACSKAINLAFLDFRPIRCIISDGPAVECHREDS